MAGVNIRGICKKFGNTKVFENLGLDINNGEFLSLVGPSGCGKSTLLRIVAGLEESNSGDVAIDGQVVNRVRPKDRNVAMVFQSYALYPHLSVYDNIALPLKMRHMSVAQRLPLLGRFIPGRRKLATQIDKEVSQTAEALRISHLLPRKPGQLSGGQRQRVALGRAMVRKPKVFLMDEPLSNLDAKLRVHMRAEIAQLNRRLKTTFIYVTHDQVEAMTMSDRIAVMIDGDILQVASPREIYNNPKDIRVAEFIGSPKINILPGRVVDGQSLEVMGLTLPVVTDLRPDSRVSVGIRPEALSIGRRDEHTIFGRITFIENLGAELLVHFRLRDAQEKVIAKLDATQLGLVAMDKEAPLCLPLHRLLIFDKTGTRVRHTMGQFARELQHG
jgi:multiple sugar transport system ATP-binding protein